MTNTQVFFSLAGMIVALAGFGKWYVDAKVDPIARDVKTLIDYLISHEGRISKLEERTK